MGKRKECKLYKYYIDDEGRPIEHSFLALYVLAAEMGFQAKIDKREKMSARNEKLMVDCIAEFLLSKSILVKIVDEPERLKLIEGGKKDDPPIKPTEMLAYFDRHLYKFDTGELDDDCWSYQVFGELSCYQCACKNKASCDGELLKKMGKNSLGHVIPIAKVVGDRPKREWGKEA
jgi:hypothetical protein